MNSLKPFRECLGQFATGVTVVTCIDKDGNPCGITANSFSSVSLDPPLVLWNIAKSSSSLHAYLNADCFVINVLTQEQRDISAHFAQSDHKLFDAVEHSISADGAPILPATLAWFECRSNQFHECGDHYIIIGQVERYQLNGGKPLLFFSGRYSALAE